jgi:recombination DNA repair RAD52 pathway protein
MREDILKQLYETFQLREREGQGGMRFKYVPNEDVINRMNKIFKGDWSTEVKDKNIVDDQVILDTFPLWFWQPANYEIY